MRSPVPTRTFGIIICACSLVSGLTVTPSADSLVQEDRARQLWRSVEQIVGPVADIRSLVLRGRFVSGFDAVTGEFGMGRGPIEYRLLLPNHFLELKEHHYGEGRVMAFRTGFRGDAAFRELDRERSSPGLTGGPADSTRPATLLQQECARLALAMVLRTDTALPLTLMAADEGGGTFEFSGPADSRTFVDLDPNSRLPDRIRYLQERRFPRTNRTQAERPVVIMPPPDVRVAEVSLLLEDRRTVAGLNLPFRIREVADGVTFQILQFEEILLNPPLRPEDFR